MDCFPNYYFSKGIFVGVVLVAILQLGHAPLNKKEIFTRTKACSILSLSLQGSKSPLPDKGGGVRKPKQLSSSKRIFKITHESSA